MSYQLIRFVDPLDAVSVIRTDHGHTATGYLVTHAPSGRQGHAFDFPDTPPNGHGARLTINHPSYVDSVDDRGYLFFNDGALPWPWPAAQQAAFCSDDNILKKKTVKLPPLVVQGQFLAQDVP